MLVCLHCRLDVGSSTCRLLFAFQLVHIAYRRVRPVGRGSLPPQYGTSKACIPPDTLHMLCTSRIAVAGPVFSGQACNSSATLVADTSQHLLTEKDDGAAELRAAFGFKSAGEYDTVAQRGSRFTFWQPDMDFPTATGLAAETSVSRGAEESPLFFFTAKNPGIGVYGVRVSQSVEPCTFVRSGALLMALDNLQKGILPTPGGTQACSRSPR